jgi:SAM-dependent methyltransferase
MPRIPGSVKRRLLPAWNAAHHWSRRAGEHLDAIRHRRFEHCVVCGRFGPMLYRPRVVPGRLAELWELTPRLTRALARRESNECAWCGAKLRARRIAQILLNTYAPEGSDGPDASVAGWVRREAVRSLRIAEINRIDGLHEVLAALPNLAYSEYDAGAEPGSVANGVRCEDSTRLTYADASFDLVLTSETLEHVPDLDAALAEIRRILVPGGYHLFTVPVLPGIATTFARARLGPDGGFEQLAPRICHPGGDIGYPVFTEFGGDLP